jgi:hypothetical protein
MCLARLLFQLASYRHTAQRTSAFPFVVVFVFFFFFSFFFPVAPALLFFFCPPPAAPSPGDPAPARFRFPIAIWPPDHADHD